MYMVCKLNKDMALFSAIFLLTIANSQFCSILEIENIIRYVSLFVLLYGCFFSCKLKFNIPKEDAVALFVVLIFLLIGIIMQDLTLDKTVYLAISMFILASIAVVPNQLIQSLRSIRYIGLAIFVGIIVSSILTIMVGGSLVTNAYEGVLFKIGFNGGFNHRNYFSYAMVSAIVALYAHCKFARPTRIDKLILIVTTIMLVLSNSRGAWIIFAMLIWFSFCHKIRLFSEISMLKMTLIGIVVIFVPSLNILLSNSVTFGYRVTGLFNYLNLYADDWFILLFGNNIIGFQNSDYSYTQNIRSILGWNGTVELVALNILIKNGLIGFVGYWLLFRKSLKRIKMIDGREKRDFMCAIWISFLFSSLVESSVGTITGVYSVVIYTILTSLSAVLNKSENKFFQDVD